MDLSTRQLRYIGVTDSSLLVLFSLVSYLHGFPYIVVSEDNRRRNIREEIKGRTCGLAFRISKATGSPDYIVRYEKLRRRLYLGQLVETLQAFILVNPARGGRTRLLPYCRRSALALIPEIGSISESRRFSRNRGTHSFLHKHCHTRGKTSWIICNFTISAESSEILDIRAFVRC